MAGITLEEAKNFLEIWLEAERRVSTGQSYTIGSRSLTRVNLSEIADRIEYWRNKVGQLEADPTGRNGGRRVWRAVPRDL